MTEPDYPLILIYSNEVLNVVPRQAHLSKATALGFIRQTDQKVAYDHNGNKWTYRLTSAQFKASFLTRLLAHTFYNPVIEVEPEWSAQGSYQLQELKAAISHCVDKDDDIITQFADADTIKTAIN
jgi:hypothetical protein